MKKSLKILGIIAGVFFVLSLTASLTGILRSYKIPTPSNEPNIKVGEHILVSNLKKVSVGEFIVFTSNYEDSLNAIYFPDFKKGTNYLHRLCAIAGDVIEMKNAVLFVNGKNFDDDLNLNNQYKISANQFSTIIEDEDKIAEENYRSIGSNNDSVLVALDKALLKKYQSQIKLALYIERDTANGPFKWFGKTAAGWTADNFGPLTVPADSYFVLGDNRHNALDSRYIGFVKTSDIKGVVLNK